MQLFLIISAGAPAMKWVGEDWGNNSHIFTLHRKWSFPIRISSVTFTKEILYGKLHFLCSVSHAVMKWRGELQTSKKIDASKVLEITNDLNMLTVVFFQHCMSLINGTMGIFLPLVSVILSYVRFVLGLFCFVLFFNILFKGFFFSILLFNVLRFYKF